MIAILGKSLGLFVRAKGASLVSNLKGTFERLPMRFLDNSSSGFNLVSDVSFGWPLVSTLGLCFNFVHGSACSRHQFQLLVLNCSRPWFQLLVSLWFQLMLGLCLNFVRGFSMHSALVSALAWPLYGVNLAILADRFLHEVAFKLWKAPKYGA
ncbi:uncharacterized protein A4U43_C03F7230 [Asparagus officinalis]|uniref:Uncharacterized protein n=1 Tax=Asparagus officinalis TaxID=4686 RepID=A0A5P1FD41_ASPOF|nr:uncharacterized protein A4U43_C03F7230 [Asparagus officinalis]